MGQMRIPCEHGSRQTVFHRDKPGGGQRDWSALPKIRDDQQNSTVWSNCFAEIGPFGEVSDRLVEFLLSSILRPCAPVTHFALCSMGLAPEAFEDRVCWHAVCKERPLVP
jgi:hypothetical protein